MRPIVLIVIHCSDSAFGDAAMIRRWHTDPPPKGNGWKDIGYHYVVLNGRRSLTAAYAPHLDGFVEAGRPEAEVGSHVKGFNMKSIGICLVGGRTAKGQSVKDSWPSEKQRHALFGLLASLETRYPEARLMGHNELNPDKTCPNLDMNTLRAAYAAWKKEPSHERIA